MRFIGNKTNLLNDISKVIKDNCDGTEKVFCDIFSGTASVSRFFKNKYTIIICIKTGIVAFMKIIHQMIIVKECI